MTLYSETVIINERASSIVYDYLRANKDKTVLFPANICPIVILAAIKARINYELIDIDSDTLCVDINFVKERKVNCDTIIFYVNSYGLPNTQLLELEKLNTLYGCKIVLDRCLCFPDFDYRPSFVDLVLYSTYQSKPVSMNFGGFGVINTNQVNIYNCNTLLYSQEDNGRVNSYISQSLMRLDQLRMHADLNWLSYSKQKYSQDEIIKYIGDVKAATVKQRKLKYVIHQIYKTKISRSDVKILNSYDWRTILTFDSSLTRDKVLSNIFGHKTFASTHYKSLCYLQKNIVATKAISLNQKVLNLFNDENITTEMALCITNIINQT